MTNSVGSHRVWRTATGREAISPPKRWLRQRISLFGRAPLASLAVQPGQLLPMLLEGQAAGVGKLDFGVGSLVY